MYLLDTDVLSYLSRPSYPPSLQRKVDRIPSAVQYTSAITLGELLFGAFRRQDNSRLLRRIEEILPPPDRILPFDEASARHYGRVRADLESAGTRIGEADLRIASIALAHGLTIVTGNIRHFDRVPGLSIENWID